MKIIIDPKTLIFVPPYHINGKKLANIKRNSFGGKPGCYLIKENGILIYVGMSKSNVYGTMYRHFQAWSDNRGISRTTYYPDPEGTKKYEVSIIITSPDYATKLERELIINFFPRDNKFKYETILSEKQSVELPAEVTADIVPF
jgi:hypothetical protein